MDENTPTPRLNGWNEWSRYVLKTLESVDKRLGDIQKDITDSKMEIERLKTRAQIWGGIMGFGASAAIMLLVQGIRWAMDRG